MQTDQCDPFRGQRKSRQYKLTELFGSPDLIKGRVGHHLLFIFPTEWHSALSSYLSLWCILFPHRVYRHPLQRGLHWSALPSDTHNINTCCLSSEEATDWSSVGVEYVGLFSSIYMFHKSEDSFIFLSGWKKKPKHCAEIPGHVKMKWIKL